MKTLLLFLILLTAPVSLFASNVAYTCDWSKFNYPRPTVSSPAKCIDAAIAYGAQNVTEVNVRTGTTSHYITFRTSNWGLESMYARYNPAADTCLTRDDYGECLEEGCLTAKPITSSSKAQTACYNQCGYTTLGGFRDYDNALAPMAYEYLPTGEVCTGSEESSQLAGVSEYTEINEEELDCRSDPGVQVCISEDKTCKIVNGQQFPPS